MANIKFSQFTQKTTLGTVDFLVGYTGADNVQIDPADLLSDYSQGTGAAGQVTFFSATSTVTGDNNLYWDNTNKKLGIGTTTPSASLHVNPSSGGNGEVNVERTSGTIINLQAQSALGVIGTNSNHDLAFKTNGNAYVRLKTNGNVGIGTSSPSSKLQVDGTLDATGISQLGSGGNNVFLTSSSAGNVGIGTSSPGSRLTVSGTNNGSSEITLINTNPSTDNDWSITPFYNDQSLRFRTNGATTTVMTLKDNGNVGIGTSSPSYPLDIVGFANSSSGFRVTDGTIDNRISWSSGNVGFFGTISNHPIAFNTNSIERMRITSGGNIILGANGNQYGLVTIRQDGTSNDNGLAVVDPSNQKSARLWSDSTNIYLSSGATGTGVLVLNEGGGNIGIGTTSPTQTLDVDGAIITEDYRAASIFYLTSGGDWIFRSDTGSERMRITSAGFVGIGTASPSTKFHVYNGEATIASSTDGVKLSYSGGNSSGVIDTAFSDNALEFRTNGSSKMFITNAGLVGIGTTSPTSKLHVAGTSFFFDQAIFDDKVGIGTSSPSEKLSLPDNAKIGLGNSADLQIYHDGSNSFITENNTGGSLIIRGSNFAVQSSDGTDDFITTVANQGVKLFYNDVEKFETTSTGVTVTGDLEIENSSDGIILESPDGTRYRVTVANGGTLSVSAV